MNISQGLYRLAQAIKWTGRVLGGFWLAGLVYGAITGSGKAGFIFVLALIFIAITEGIAWILEGFASDK
jgi:hypothetical protein